MSGSPLWTLMRVLTFDCLTQLAPSGKVIGSASTGPLAETSSVPSIHAIGDCLEGKPELTPVRQYFMVLFVPTKVHELSRTSQCCI